MKHYLDKDRTRYGNKTDYEIEEGEMDEWLDDVNAAVDKANV